jgi:hypothetical protein
MIKKELLQKKKKNKEISGGAFYNLIIFKQVL